MARDVSSKSPEIQTTAGPAFDPVRKKSNRNLGQATNEHSGDSPPAPAYTKETGKFRTIREAAKGIKSPVDKIINENGGILDVKLWRLGKGSHPASRIWGATGGLVGAEWGYAHEKNDRRKQWLLEGRTVWGALSNGRIHRDRQRRENGDHLNNVYEGSILLGLAHGKWETIKWKGGREIGNPNNDERKWYGALGWGLAYAEMDLHRWSRQDGNRGRRIKLKNGALWLAQAKLDKTVVESDGQGNKHIESKKTIEILGIARKVEKTKDYNQQGELTKREKAVVWKAFGRPFGGKREGGGRPFESRYGEFELTEQPPSSSKKETVVGEPPQPQEETSEWRGGEIVEVTRRS